MNSILAEYGLPVTALIVAMISLFLSIKQEREFRKMIDSDKEFMEWRERRKRSDN